MKLIFSRGPAFLLCALLWHAGFSAQAGLATVWHIPDNTSDLGFNMRNPEFEIGTNTTITFYTGLWKFNGATQLANETGGTLYYKSSVQSAWSSASLNFYSNNSTTGNQYWQASFNTSGFGPDDVIQYYFLLTFDGFNGVTNTCLYGGDGGSSTTGSTNVAAASPFSLRNRPGWIFHNGNRVVTANANGTNSTVSFWTEIGYQGKDGTAGSRWANHGCVYYTTDGTIPAGSLGIGGGTTRVRPLSYDHEQDNSSIAGNAMWWSATVTNLPDNTAINYKIGAWNSANNEEKFADYNAGTLNTVFSFSIGATTGTNGTPVLTVNGVNAEYTTEHLFVSETAGDAIPVTVAFAPNTNNVVEADVFSNLNRRNRATQDANGDGIEDGIVPPDGNLIATGDDNNYYKAYAMTPVGGGQYSLTLSATNCGAYRLTARYKVAGNTNWFWYGRRDHAIVVTPTKARNISMYELNALTIGAQGTNQNDRSTFTDLYGGPGARPYDAVTNRFNLQYVQNLGVNWLWFQPCHPTGIDGRQTDPNTGLPYSVGSPYAVKNFFQINPLLSKANTRDAALAEFTNFVAAADAAGVNVMLDEPFNHTAYDCELDASGVYYFATNAAPTDEIRNREARFYSLSGDYCQRASSAGNVAVAPDRGDFGKFGDTHDVFFGRYAALVCQNPSDNGNYLNEADTFDYSVNPGNFDHVTQNVWRYFSDCILYWLDQTGCPQGTPASQTYKGIDGLRADFGQGLPPQAWEYIINKVRTRKWDFVFMTESLDGGAVTYRSNRHFDVLNENLIFSLESASSASDYRNAFDSRRTAYGQGLVLLNHVSHDEQSYGDPYQALVRHAVVSSIDGAPMIFYGEELGISTTFGFNLYELNFGKNIPHFKTFNSLQPIFNPANRNYGLDQLWPVYAGINQARQFSAALKSSNRYYLDQQNGGGPQANIFSVAKYETANGAPNSNDVVLAFATLDRNNTQSGTFNVNITQNGANLFGIKPARLYNVKNISAYTAIDGNRRNFWLWNGGGGGIAGSNVLANGVFVSLNPVPTTNGGWAGNPFEAQYLKLYDVTPPPAPSAPGTGSTNNYVFSHSVTFSWAAVTDSEGGISGYHVLVGTTPGGSDVTNVTVNGTSLSVTANFGARLYATVTAVNHAGIESSAATSPGISLLNPAWVPVASMTPPAQLNWSSVSGLTYRVWSTTNLMAPFTAYGGTVTATVSSLTFTNNPTNSARYFRVQLIP